MKRTVIAAFAVLLAAPAFAQEFPPLQGKPVLDAANVIPQETEDRLNEKLFAYQRTSGHQIAVVTVPTLGDREINDYGNKYFRFLGLGDRDADDGVLLLVAPNEKKVRIEVGYGLTPVLTDAQSGLIVQNTILPKFRDRDMPGGIEAGADQLIASTQMTTGEIAALKARQEKRAAIRRAEIADGWNEFWFWVGSILGLGGATWGGWWLLTGPARKRRREEEARIRREQIAAFQEQQRRDSEAALERARLRREAAEQAQRDRTNMLARMSPEKRHAFLEGERREQERQREEERRRERARQEADRRRREEDEARARRRRDEAAAVGYGGGYASGSSGSSWSSSDDSSRSSSSSSSDYSGGGGSSGGGGASGSWD